ncbi:MAG: FKBP-type peptidyl-prolyl cis-trans isomerase [Elusimicrobia bacterium]|nr:FKBP-type peptidyl-prolyl cis-trans isomerase [Elusimicrobiota bacterium]
MRAVLGAALLLAACSRDGRVGPGSVVTLDYELSSGGAVIESSAGREPLVVTQGDGNLPGPVDEILVGLRPGDEKVLELTPDQGFGPVDPAKIRAIPLSRFGALAKDLVPGRTVVGAEGGKANEARVIKIEKGAATLDFNHPLAGKALRYKIKVVSIRPR